MTGQQRFERALRATSYALLLAGLAGLLASEALSPVGGAVCLGLILLSWRLRTDWPKRHPLLVFLILAFAFLFDWILLTGPVDASLHLLLGISLIKLFGDQRDKDYGLLYGVSFLFLLIASVYTLSVLFLVVLLGWVFTGILTFVLFESRRAFRQNPQAQFELGGYVRVSLLMTVLVAVVSAPIFVSIPRTNWGLFRVGDFQDGNLSGFSDRVVLGDIGRIMTNRDLFMRVRINRDSSAISADWKWRGVALNFYDGLAWSNTEREYQPLPLGALRDESSSEELRAKERGLLRQHVAMEPGSDVVFGLGRIVQVIPRERGLGGLILRDGNQSLRFYRTPSGPLHYTVDSELLPRAQRLKEVSEWTIPAEIGQRFLQLPELDPRIRGLAARLTVAAPDPLAKALLLENHLRRAYGYSLDNLAATAEDPLAAFLFEQRAGHCEFFATAMAVMLRAQGVPSRVVNGFRVGEYNDWGGYWLVRQSDAHSWVEAFFPGAGWIEFDPTPAATGFGTSRLGRWLGQMLDAVDLFWTEVVTFDRIKQLTFFIRARQRLREVWKGLSSGVDLLDPAGWLGTRLNLRFWKSLAWPLALGTLGLGILLWLLKSRLAGWLRRAFGGKGTQDPPPSFYLEFLERLRRKGFSRGRAETPWEFALRMNAELASPLPGQLTELYYHTRFGSKEVSSERLRKLSVEWKKSRLGRRR